MNLLLRKLSNIRNQKNKKPYIYIILLTVKGEKEDVVKALLDGEADRLYC